jgi:hypothetical protein
MWGNYRLQNLRTLRVWRGGCGLASQGVLKGAPAQQSPALASAAFFACCTRSNVAGRPAEARTGHGAGGGMGAKVGGGYDARSQVSERCNEPGYSVKSRVYCTQQYSLTDRRTDIVKLVHD